MIPGGWAIILNVHGHGMESAGQSAGLIGGSREPELGHGP